MSSLVVIPATILVVFSAVSAEAGERSSPVRSLLEMRQEGVVVQRWDISCGAAALATVLTYRFNDPVSEKALAESMLRRTDPLRVKVRGGFSLLDLKRAALMRGYNAAGYRKLRLENLVRLEGAIVPIQIHGYNHFVVFQGIRDGRRVMLADPAFGNRTMAVKAFMKSWLDGLAFVVTDHRQ